MMMMIIIIIIIVIIIIKTVQLKTQGVWVIPNVFFCFFFSISNLTNEDILYIECTAGKFQELNFDLPAFIV